MKVKLEQKQIQEQVEIHETLRTRSLEVVNNENQVIARISEETPDSDEETREKKITTFFDDEGNEIACLGTNKSGNPTFKLGTNKSDYATFKVFGSSGDVSISSGYFGGSLSTSYVGTDDTEFTLSIHRNLFGFRISVYNNQGKGIGLEIDVDEGKVEIESISEIESENKEIRTTQTIFKSAE